MLQDIPKETVTTLTSLNTTNSADSAPQSIDASTLKAWEDNHDDLMIIDVRSGAEFDSLHIKGSYHVPLAMLGEHTEAFAAKMGTRVVLVCQSGNRAEQARKHLDSVGLACASVLSGGVPAYAAAEGNVVRGRGPWALERQVRMTAGSLVLASIVAAKFVSPKLGLVAGGIGAGLTFSAATNSCAMGQVLSKMPWNRSANEPTAHQALQNLDARA
jgi:rhodanese-related sulfurtransferase